MWSVGNLKGKYYGTGVLFDDCEVFSVWWSDHTAVPFGSEREIERGWTQGDGHDHVEDEQSLRLAREIVSHLNAVNFKLK